MALLRSSLSFLIGTGFGIYAAQNYDVPNIRKLFNTALVIVKYYEETYRKPPNKPTDQDHRS